MDEEHLKAIVTGFDEMMSQNKVVPEEQKANLRQQRDHFFSLLGQVCAVVHVVAEPDMAEEYAVIETKRVLDVLRYAILNAIDNPAQLSFGLQGEINNNRRYILTIDSPMVGFSFKYSMVNATLPFNITAETVQIMESAGLSKLSEILSKKSPTEFEQMIIQGLHWLSNGQTELEPEHRLLSLAICLETFFTPRDEAERIMSAIGDGLAFTLYTALEDRKQVKKDIKSLYGKRSKISHGHTKGGKDSDPITMADIDKLTGLAGSAIYWLLNHRTQFVKKDGLLEWIADQRLSSTENG